MLNASTNKYTTESTINLLINYGGELTPECFNLACKNKNSNIIIKCLENGIKPRKEDVTELFNEQSKYYASSINYESILLAFSKSGYEFTYENLLSATKIEAIIPDFGKYKFVFDDSFFKICEETSFYPPYPVQYPISCLQKECGNLYNHRILTKVSRYF